MMRTPSGDKEAKTVRGSTSVGICIFFVKFFVTIPPSSCFSSCFPDTSTNPSLVFTCNSSGLKLWTFTQTFQGSPQVVVGELREEGSPYLLVYSWGPPVDWRGGKPVRKLLLKGEELRRVLSRPGRAHPGQSIDRSSGKGGIPNSSSINRDANWSLKGDWSLNGDWSMNGDSPNGSLGNLCRFPVV